jgi:hypothetical protein
VTDLPHRPDTRLTDVTQLRIPGMEGLWPHALLVGEAVVERLLEIDDREQAEMIPQEIAVSPHQLELELERRQIGWP